MCCEISKALAKHLFTPLVKDLANETTSVNTGSDQLLWFQESNDINTLPVAPSFTPYKRDSFLKPTVRNSVTFY